MDSDTEATGYGLGAIPVTPDTYHVYLDLATGHWGNRQDVAVVALTHSELQKFAALTDSERREQWAGATRYWSDVPVAKARHYLSAKDTPTVRPHDPVLPNRTGGPFKCSQCGEPLRQVPGGNGPVWVSGIGYATCLAP